jgi:hypothetical protein
MSKAAREAVGERMIETSQKKRLYTPRFMGLLLRDPSIVARTYSVTSASSFRSSVIARSVNRSAVLAVEVKGQRAP